jgi:hypothetical protein
VKTGFAATCALPQVASAGDPIPDCTVDAGGACTLPAEDDTDSGLDSPRLGSGNERELLQ